MFGGVESCGGGGSCIGEYLLCLWVKIKWVRSGLAMEITVGLWRVSGGDQGRGCKLVVAVRAVLFWLLIAMNLLLLINVDFFFLVDLILGWVLVVLLVCFFFFFLVR